MVLSPERRLAKYIPHILASLNEVCLQLRDEHERILRYAGAGAEQALGPSRLVPWHFGTTAYTYLQLDLDRREDWPLTCDVENNRMWIVTPEARILVASTVVEDEPKPDCGTMPFVVPEQVRPEWQLRWQLRWPHSDRVIVPPLTRTLGRNGWCPPSARALATPLIDLDAPLALLDYMERAILVDRRSVSRKMPVYDRAVAMGRAERLILCPLDAQGHLWIANE